MKNNDTLNRKRVLNATIETLDLKKIIDNAELPTEDRLSAISIQKKNIKEIADVIKVSKFKGKNGVLSMMARFLEAVNEMDETLTKGDEVIADLLDSKDFLAYRLQNKMCERLFPDDDTYIGGRLERVIKQAKALKPVIALRLTQSGAISKLDDYDNVYIFEEDEESIILKKVLEDMGVKNIKAFVSPKDAFGLGESKILSFEEARISDRDALIISSPSCIRTKDIELAKKENIKNILELDIFSD